MSTNKALVHILEKEFGKITFAMFLRSARSMAGLTQVELAKKLKIAAGTLCDIEKGRQLVSIQLASNIAKKLGLSVPQAVQAAIQDQLRKAKLALKVNVGA